MQPNIQLLILAATIVNSATNEPCVGSGGLAGVCVLASECTRGGGITVNSCPRAAPNVRCCTKRACGTSGSAGLRVQQQNILADEILDQNQQQLIYSEEPFGAEDPFEEILDNQEQPLSFDEDKPLSSAEGISTLQTGNCRWTSDCASKSFGTVCPGPNQFMCCTSNAPGFGGYPTTITHFTGCSQVVVDIAGRIIKHFPGRIRELYCYRNCKCDPNSDHDHCCGKATDLMCSDSGGHATMSGQQIAEWIMNNRVVLRLKYVIWGQRIWDVREDTVKPWKFWKTMEDRGSITQNHWDHVHVSYR